jgi:mannosyltransferase OCH1-like enzyme
MAPSKKIAILSPSRERSHKIVKQHQHWFQYTDSNISTDCIIILDNDNEHTYERLEGFIYYVVESTGKRGLVYPLNQIACKICNNYEYIGFWGDDHFLQIMNWNTIMYNKLQRNSPYAIVYANDLLHESRLCTHLIMDALFIQKLGYMSHPTFTHLFADNAWMYLGLYMNNIHYISEVIIEHQHYYNNKCPLDTMYEQVNSLEIQQSDQIAYDNLINNEEFKNNLEEIKNNNIRTKYITHIGLPDVNGKICGPAGWPRYDRFRAEYTHPDISTECVPKNMHFVWIGSPIPYKYVKNIQTFVATNKPIGFTFTLWVDTDTPPIDDITIIDIRSNFPGPNGIFINRATYDIETNWSAKADILKYELIYHVGGIYCDLDAKSLKAYDEHFAHAFVCHAGQPYNDIGTCFFGFPAGSHFLKYVIDCIAEVRTYSFNFASLPTPIRVCLLTGPILFTQCFQNYNDPGIQMINQDLVVLQPNNPDAYSYHTFDSTLPTGWHNQK